MSWQENEDDEIYKCDSGQVSSKMLSEQFANRDAVDMKGLRL